MLKKRIIPCLDIKNSRTVKGCNFVDLIDAGDPIELAKKYSEDGADELVFLDISATLEERKTFIPLVEQIAKVIQIPFTVGGGISHVEQIQALLHAGADKVSLNSSILKNPELIREASELFGAQCIVAAIDAKKDGNIWKVYSHGGTQETEKELLSWAKEIEEKGAGEILLTSINADGTKQGFDIEMLQALEKNIHIPFIASGGAGSTEHFSELFQKTQATGALAASIFHFQEIPIQELKASLLEKNIAIRR